jgi:hypothetical protein
MNNKLKKKSPAKLFGLGKLIGGIAAKAKAAGGLSSLISLNPLAAAGVAIGGAYLYSKYKKEKRKGKLVNTSINNAQADYDARMQEYEDKEYTPIDPSIVDQENLFEDMEIDMTGFEMQRKAFLQSQANILQTLQNVGGTSGAAGLAQALSVQADKQSEQMGQTVSQMMNRSRELRIQEDSRINQAMTQIELANADGARQFELEKLQTLLNVDAQELAGAKADKANRRNQQGNLLGTVGKIAGAYYGNGGGGFSLDFLKTSP